MLLLIKIILIFLIGSATHTLIGFKFIQSPPVLMFMNSFGSITRGSWVLSLADSSKFWIIAAIAALLCNNANLIPKQMRGPSPEKKKHELI
jgi:hypothetical protein